MKTELIEDLKKALVGVNNSIYENTIFRAIQALEKQESEQVSADEVLKKTWQNTEGGDRWLNGQGNKKFYREDIVIRAMQTYASKQSDAVEFGQFLFAGVPQKWIENKYNQFRKEK